VSDGRSRALLAWYETAQRDLPWRATTDPWAILVSEVMLQQTQVARVIPAYRRFLARFPTPADLAEADLGEVLVAWDGLGYQRRAVNLWRAAAVVTATGWPETVDGLQRLPGVGGYTAAAVACFAFGAPVAAFDTNHRRVLSRWQGSAATPADAALLCPAADAARWNQAVMDLGATLCLPRNPRCQQCPVATWCSDPGFYLAPPPQTRYRGSVRQARAAVLRHLAAGLPSDIATLTTTLGLDPDRVGMAVEALVGEGILTATDGRLALAGGAPTRATPP
jgi:A/G-specific adenine glycosylase